MSTPAMSDRYDDSRTVKDCTCLKRNGTSFGRVARRQAKRQGSLTKPDGVVYTGRWWNDMLHGDGECIDSYTGEKFSCNFERTHAHGILVYSFSSKETITAPFDHGKPLGPATYANGRGESVEVTWHACDAINLGAHATREVARRALLSMPKTTNMKSRMRHKNRETGWTKGQVICETHGRSNFVC